MTSTGTRLAGAAAAAAFALTFTAHTRAGRLDQQEIRVETRSTTGPISIGGLPGGDNAAPMEQGTALIVGQAVEANSTRPIGGALVTLGLPGARPLRVLADGEGRFAFRGLPKGRFNITATKPGYVEGAYGRLRPAGQSLSLELADGERVSNVKVPLWKYGAVAGTLLDESGEPIIGATVRVLKRTISNGRPKLATGPADQTDDRGAYRIGMLEPGEYVVVVPMPTPLFLTSGVSPVRLALNDMPAVGALGGGGGGVTFTASVEMSPNGFVTVNTIDSNGTSAGVAADGRPLVYPTVFYPTAASASRATAVTLGSGEERTGLDFVMKAARTMRVSGVVAGPQGPTPNVSVTLVPAEADDLVSPVETATAMTDGVGAFTFPGVPAGSYALHVIQSPRGGGPAGETFTYSTANGNATFVTRSIVVNGSAPQPPLPTDPTLWGDGTVSVGNQDVAGLSINLRAGARVNGLVDFSGGAQRPAADRLSAISVTLEPADAKTSAMTSSVRGRVDANGSFSTMGVPPGKYFLRAANAPQGWTFRGATAGGRDVTDTPLEIESNDVGGVTLTFADQIAELKGTVAPASGAGDPAASVIIFPAEREGWVNYGSNPRRLRSVRADTKGAYTISNIPAGRYYVAAVNERMASDWQDPKFLEALANDATQIQVSDGQKLTQSLKVVR